MTKYDSDLSHNMSTLSQNEYQMIVLLIYIQGRFEILLLSGLLLGKNDLCSQTGGLTVLLAGPNSRVFGGRLAGILIAASPVQVCPCSIFCDMP